MKKPAVHETTPERLIGHLNETERKHAPARLFYAGEPVIARDWLRVSIVGSRKASDAGLESAAKLAAFLAVHDVTVVSGLAEGIDAAAHRAAMSDGGRTLAVLGTGLDRVYPAAHTQLQDAIMKDQLAVSQFPLGTPPRRGNFPMRNRTMALLSDASVIIEAGERSGTKHQGWEALRLGRPLLLLPTLAEDPRLTWPSKMREYGALVLSEPEELIEILGSERAVDPVDQVAL